MQTQAVRKEQLLRCDVNAAGWFEIAVRDLKRAKAFYESVFGIELDVQRMGDYDLAMFPMKMEFGGAAGCLSKGPEAEPSHKGTLVYFSVTDINAVLARVRESGGKVLREKVSIDKYGYIGLFEDTEGNRLGLHSCPSS